MFTNVRLITAITAVASLLPGAMASAQESRDAWPHPRQQPTPKEFQVPKPRLGLPDLIPVAQNSNSTVPSPRNLLPEKRFDVSPIALQTSSDTPVVVGAQAAKETVVPQGANATVTGKILRVEKDKIVVETAGGGAMFLYVDPAAKIVNAGTNVAYHDLAPGTTFTAIYTPRGERLWVTTLNVAPTTPPPAVEVRPAPGVEVRPVVPAPAVEVRPTVPAVEVRPTVPTPRVEVRPTVPAPVVEVRPTVPAVEVRPTVPAVEVRPVPPQAAPVEVRPITPAVEVSPTGPLVPIEKPKTVVVVPAVPATAYETEIVRVAAPDQIVVRNASGNEFTVYVTPQTRYMVGDTAAAFADFRPGMRIRIDDEVRADRHVARHILGVRR